MQNEVRRALTEEVRAFVSEAGTRRAFGVTVHVGTPGGERVSFADESGTDPVLRADCISAALDALSGGVGAWVGVPGTGEPDVPAWQWYAASGAAFARHGWPLEVFVVLNRSGWIDLVSGERRRWHRVRPARLVEHSARALPHDR